MSADADAGQVAPAAPAARRWFRPAASVPQLTAAQRDRESRVVRSAFDGLGAERAGSFLNSFDASLGGRPLAIATGSPEGAEAVERAIIACRLQVR